MKLKNPLAFFSKLKWLDKTPLVIEPYRARIFEQALFTFDELGRLFYNLVLALRGKKNNKSLDMILAALYCLCCRAHKTPGGFIGLILGFDEAQGGLDLDLTKKLIRVNPVLKELLAMKQKSVERRDGKGILEIRPGRDILGQHGGTWDFLGLDELHTQRDYGLLEALAADPTKEALMWITSYNSIFHRPGVPLHDYIQTGWGRTDERMLFSYYDAQRSTDPDFQGEDLTPEQRANPSMASWTNKNYLEQEKRRLPSHKYRRLHLNLPGAPEGSAFSAEMIDAAIVRGVKVRRPELEIHYMGFVDMSGGSSDDACLGIAHQDTDGRAILDLLIKQTGRPPFEPNQAVKKFAQALKSYRCYSVTGDRFAGNTFAAAFESEGISYQPSELTKSQLYEALEPKLNSGEVVLLDHPMLESQLVGLVWRGNRIDHPAGVNEHDDFCNAAAGAIHHAFEGEAGSISDVFVGGTTLPVLDWGNPRTESTGGNYDDFDDRIENSPGSASGGSSNREWWL